MSLPLDDLEATWERLALAHDQAGEHAERFLAKLALLLAEALGDGPRVAALIDAALEDLE